jgi:AraC-like DNA-binding protein
MRVARRPRAAVLRPLVRSIAYHESALPPALERILPTAGVDLMVNLYEDEIRTYHGPKLGSVTRVGGAVLGGAHAVPTVIDTRGMRCMVSVMFEVGGAAPFFPLPLSEAGDRLVPLDDVWGRDGAVLRERLLEASTPEAKLDLVERTLLRHLGIGRDADPLVRYAAAALSRGAAVFEVASDVGVLPKTFVRRFREQAGMTPKRFARVHRMQRMLHAASCLDEPNWPRLAVEHGYYDQAHLVNDFRELTGTTPTAYSARSPDEHNHVPVPI